MLRSMFAGVSGLRSHQTMMDVIGNNIANVNTVGFKSAQVTFGDILSQTISGASSPQGGSGGINAQQIGLGVKIASITDLHTQGALMSTGRATDLAIQGDGFFVVNDGTRNLYTRAGSFLIDAGGNLVSSNTGYVVQGWTADAIGDINTNATPGNLTVPAGTTMPPRATENATWTGNLDASMAIGDSAVTTITAYDSQGGAHQLEVTFTKVNDNQWDWTADVDGNPGAGSGTIDFDTDGTYLSPPPGDIIGYNPIGATPMSISTDFTGLTQYASPWTAQASYQDGYTSGALRAISVSNRGEISGVFSNGLSLLLGQVATANFNNPSGLQKEGDNFYVPSTNSGNAAIGEAGAGGRGFVTAGALEMSNVDLAKEFTNMIVAQRGFQANSRVISTSDDMLQELVNLKR